MKRLPPEPPTRRRRQTAAELKELQRITFSAIRRPLSRNNAMQRKWTDGRSTQQVVSQFIKPNDRLTSLERIELYNKQYWFRLLDCLYDDYPGLRAILGESKFRTLRIAYLNEHPSKSFTMRNLGSRLVEFIEKNPRLISPHTAMCQDMARFEWAQIVAFDGVALPPLVPDDLLGRDPATLTLGLQPYLTLLEMGYSLDEFVLAVKKKSLRAEASNAMEMEEHSSSRKRTVRLPRPKTIHLGVHRWNNSLYYKRLDVEAYRLLCALRDGQSVADACAAAIGESDDAAIDWPARIREWFKIWTELGWFCKRK